jgi:hypothetical protein
MSSVSDNRIEVIRAVKPNTAAGWLGQAKAVGSSTTANASLFTAIASVLGKLASDTSDLDTAEAAAKNRGKDEVQARNAKWALLRKSYRATCIAVQGLCDAAPDEAHARAIAAAAGLPVKDRPVHIKGAFEGKPLGNGTVRLTVKVPVKKGAKCYYEWRMSTDGGKTWASLPGSNDCTTLVQGLTPTTLVEFSFRFTSKNTSSAWSNGVPVQIS